MPVRNRYKVFIIDEVHQLSTPSFNALLKSIEEPPPHVVFMMATTELDKIPETVLSRSQVYEFRTISTQGDRRAAAADRRRREASRSATTSLQLIARDAEGSMRDAQSKLDQVIAFTGKTITRRRCRDGARPGRPRPAARHACRRWPTRTRRRRSRWPAAPSRWATTCALVCRELSRVVRDLLVLSVDPSRVDDPEIAGEGERDRLTALADALLARGSAARVRSADASAEADIRGAAQPRYHLEMALLRWIHLRKLVPIEDLIAGGGAGGRDAAPAAAAPSRDRADAAAGAAPVAPQRAPARRRGRVAPARRRRRASTAQPSAPRAPAAPHRQRSRRVRSRAATATSGDFKDAFLAEIRKSKAVFYNTVVAQAQKIEVAGDRVTFTFSPTQRALREQFEQNRAWLESIAQQARRTQDRGRVGAGRCGRRAAAAAGERRRRRRRSGRDTKRDAARAGARRRRRAGDARSVSRRRSATSRRCEADMNIQQMMKQAQQMQERLQKQMAELRVEGNAGGGMVTVVVNGAKQLQSLKIDPEVVSKDDVEMLQDLIVAAINDAQRKADEEMAQKMGGMLPPGMKLPGM